MKHVTRMAMMALGAMVLSSSIAVADNCKIVRGTISPLQPVVPCLSPYGCFTGTFSGDLSGTFQSVLTYAAPTPTDPQTAPPTATLIFTALTAIETRAPNGTLNGTLYTRDAGLSYCTVTPDGLLFCPNSHEVLTVTSGSGAYAQAHGLIHLTGPYLAGQPGTYQGQICTHKPK